MYVLYSALIDRYYVGSTTCLPAERLRRHLSNHSGFTSRTKDWKVVYVEVFIDILSAKERERQIKSWKSRPRLEQLVNSSEHPA